MRVVNGIVIFKRISGKDNSLFVVRCGIICYNIYWVTDIMAAKDKAFLSLLFFAAIVIQTEQIKITGNLIYKNLII